VTPLRHITSSKSSDTSAERSETVFDSTRSLTTYEGENNHGTRPEAWHESYRVPDTSDRTPDTRNTSDNKSPDTDDSLLDNTKGRRTGSSDRSPQSNFKS
jgi:hypothetical protein